MKERTLEGDFPTYDEDSRAAGKMMLWMVMLIIGVAFAKEMWFHYL